MQVEFLDPGTPDSPLTVSVAGTQITLRLATDSRGTLDGSTPTTSSTTWNATSPRQPGQVFLFDRTATIKWIAADMKGNVSEVRWADFVIQTDHQ